MDFPQIVIKLVKEKDLNQIKIIWNQHYQFLSSSKQILTKESILQRFRTRNKGNHDYIGYYINDILRGFVIIRELEEKFWIKMIAVEKGFQFKGIGTGLINFVYTCIKGPIFIECFPENIIGLNFFIKRGFRCVKYDSMEKELILSKE